MSALSPLSPPCLSFPLQMKPATFFPSRTTPSANATSLLRKYVSLSVSTPTSTGLILSQIGFGNWGSVWLCRPKDDEGQPVQDHAAVEARGMGKVAVKLVHRSKTSTTAARVRSL